MPSTVNSRMAEIEAKVSEPEETLSVPWQNSRRALPVITLSVDSVVLNPRSHRIRSQIESHPRADILEHDPFSESAQRIIATILAETIGFGPLVDNLKEEGQLEAGIITSAGVLLNGNTRAVALREIRIGYIRVAVLPDGATEKELTELEARLQLARDYKQDYTLTNEFLFIKEQIETGTRVEDLAFLLGKAQSRSPAHIRKGVAEIEKSLRVLQHIREIQQMSNYTIPLVFFDEHDSALREADNAYIALRDRSPTEAHRVRDGRMAGVLSRVTYRNLRNWDSDEFLKDYLEPQFEDDEDLLAFVNSDNTEVAAESPSEDDGLGVLAGLDAETETAVDPSRLLTTLASHFGAPKEATVIEGMTKGELFDGVQERITQAADERAQDRRDEKRQSTPLKLVREARNKVARARQALARASRDNTFNQGKFDYELRKLRRELNLLAKANEVDS